MTILPNNNGTVSNSDYLVVDASGRERITRKAIEAVCTPFKGEANAFHCPICEDAKLTIKGKSDPAVFTCWNYPKDAEHLGRISGHIKRQLQIIDSFEQALKPGATKSRVKPAKVRVEESLDEIESYLIVLRDEAFTKVPYRSLASCLLTIDRWVAEQRPQYKTCLFEIKKRFGELYAETKNKRPAMDGDGLKKTRIQLLVETLEREANGCLRLNEMTKEVEWNFDSEPLIDLRLFVSDLTGLEAPVELLAEAVSSVSRKNSYHPVRDYLKHVYGVYGSSTEHLLNSPSSLLLKTTDELSDLFLRTRLIASVRRVFEPGCKLDEVTVLHGVQGTGKSTFWELLASPQNFTRSIGVNLHDKDELMKLNRAWFVELSEFDGITTNKEATAIKAFTSCSEDFYRSPYERIPRKHPRMCSIVATVNETGFLVDPTGNRRFQIITVEQDIDLDLVRDIRDELWAGAYSLYLKGELSYLPREQQQESERRNKRYEQADDWENLIERYLQNEDNYIKSNGVEYILAEQVLLQGVGLRPDSLNHAARKRVSRILRGFDFEQANGGNKVNLSMVDTATGKLVTQRVRAWVRSGLG